MMCCSYILPFITHMVNVCISDSVFPDLWKHAVVSPIPKVNAPTDFRDLRPISILPAMSKLIERHLFRQLSDYLESRRLLPDCQSGFRKNHGCCTALLKVSDDIIRATDQGCVTVVVLLDFSRAFDTVSHSRLLCILQSAGLERSALDLLSQYIGGRRQMVKVGEHCSRILPVDSGVPQGSILGPLLFCVYTSQLLRHLRHCSGHMYADDTQIYLSFKPADWATAESQINDDLVVVQRLASELCLKLNPSKSQTIVFGSTRHVEFIAASIGVQMDGVRLPVLSEVKNLGIVMDNTFRYRGQVSVCLRRAYSGLRLLYPLRHCLSRDTKRRLCDSLILSHFAYCAPLYHSAIDSVDVRRIQRVQNSCLRYIYGIRKYDHVTYKLQEVGWLNMTNRRKLQCLVFYHRLITTGKPPYLYNKITFRSDVHNLNTRFRGRLSPPSHRLALFRRSFTYQICNAYNNVPGTMRHTAPSTFRDKMFCSLLMSQ